MMNGAQTIAEEVESSIEMLNEHGSDGSHRHSSVSDVIQKITNLYTPQAKQKDIVLRIDKVFDRSVPVSETFGIKLIRILRNLVANGLKFTPHGGTIRAQFDVTLPIEPVAE